jgi:hypothetical protein
LFADVELPVAEHATVPVLAVAAAGLNADADFEWFNLDVIWSLDDTHEKWNMPVVPLECHGKGAFFHRLYIFSIIPVFWLRGILAVSFGSSFRKQGTMDEIFPDVITITGFRL